MKDFKMVTKKCIQTFRKIILFMIDMVHSKIQGSFYDIAGVHVCGIHYHKEIRIPFDGMFTIKALIYMYSISYILYLEDVYQGFDLHVQY